MNHKHRQTLHALFAHPEPSNLSESDVKTVLREVGGEIEERTGSRYAVTLNGHTAVFHHADHSVRKDDVRGIRKFLADAGVDPEAQYPL